MTTDRTATAKTLFGAMHELHVGGRDETALWLRLEAEALDLLANCDGDTLITSLPTYLAGSEAVLRALPPRPAFRRIFGTDDERRLRLNMPVEAYCAAIEQKFLRPGQIDRMLAHHPGDQRWTRYLCETLSPLDAFRHNGIWSPWARLSLPGPVDYDRVAAVIAAQIRDHPREMSTNLEHYLTDNITTAAALVIAGVALPQDPRASSPEGKEFIERASSHHGMISIHAEYGPLDRAIRALIDVEDPQSPRLQ